MSYAAFGGLQVTINDVVTPITRTRERQVLGSLIAARGVPTTAERLAADIWGADSAPTTVGLVQVAVSRLRSLLEPDRVQRHGNRLVSTAAGYELHAESDDVDVWQFEALAYQVLNGTHGAKEVVQLCSAALELWSAPYAGVSTPATARHADRLSELHADLQAEFGRALLDCGQPEAVVRLLTDVVDEHAYREPLWCLLALAQYRSHRQVNALATLRTLRTTMVEELGIDPATQTLELENAILRHDANLLTEPVLGSAHSRLEPDVGNRQSGPGSLPGTPSESRSDEASPRSSPSAHTHRSPPPNAVDALVGRDAELAVGESVLEDALAEPGRALLLVAGEPGIGKTAYLRALQELATRRGFEVLVGHSHDGDVAPPLWPWLEIIRPILDSAPDAVRDLLQPVITPQVPDPRAIEHPMRTYDAVVDLLAARAATRPLLVLLEDLNFADTATLQLLRNVARASFAAPLVVAMTRRTTEAITPELLDCLAELSRAGVSRVRLDGLDVVAVGAMLTRIVGEHDPELDVFVTEFTGGNAFFVLQYAALLAARPRGEEFDPAALDLPLGVKFVLLQRFGQLPETVRAIVWAAAVFASDIEPEALALLVDTPIDDVLSALDEAVSVGLMVEQGTQYAFVHALARDTAYTQLALARRIRMHDRASRVLETLHDGELDAVTAIAQHAWSASSLSLQHRERAVTWRIRAAQLALVQHADGEALRLWRDVLGVVPDQSETAALAHGGAAVALMNLMRLDEAAAEIQAGLETARTLGQWELVTELVGTLAVAGPWAWPITGQLQAGFVDVLKEAVPQVSSPSRALLLAILEVQLYYLADPVDRGGYAVEALELARQSEDPDLLRRVLVFLLVGTTGTWPVSQREQLIDELFALDPQEYLLVSALLSRVVVEWECLRPDAADAAMARCAAEAERLGIGSVGLLLAWWRATRARDRDAPDADRLLEEVAELHRSSGAYGVEDVLWFVATRYRGGEEIEQRLRDCPPPLFATSRLAAADALLQRGQVDQARAALGDAFWTDSPGTGVDALCYQVTILARLGSPAQLGEAVRALEPYRGLTNCPGTWVDHCGVTDYFLAVGYAALGDPRALALATDAVAANELLGVRPWIRRASALVDSLSTGLPGRRQVGDNSVETLLQDDRVHPRA